MQGQRWMNTERLYRHCKCGDLLQEATGNGEEETERLQRGKKNLVRVETRKVAFKNCAGGSANSVWLLPAGPHLESFLNVAVVVDDLCGSRISFVSGGALQRGQCQPDLSL